MREREKRENRNKERKKHAICKLSKPVLQILNSVAQDLRMWR